MHPFVKWAGGKTQLLSKIKELMPKEYNRYFEPFVGGGALLFEIKPKEFTINDFNSELIEAYKSLTNKSDFELLKESLKVHENEHSEEHYYQVRELDKSKDFVELPRHARAARMIYLNKACFNGLYRVNAKGYFNVPSGKKKKVTCFEESNLNDLYNFFKSSSYEILNGDFEEAVRNAKKGDFVYFDPPYVPLNETSSFTSYTKDGFDMDMQFKLREVCDELDSMGVMLMLSNSDTKFVNELYSNYEIKKVFASRAVNANAEGRGKITEVLVRNY